MQDLLAPHPNPRQTSRPPTGFRPLSRTQTATTHEHPQEKAQKAQDTMLLSQLLISKDFCATQESQKPQTEEPEKDDDEIEGDEFQEDDVNYQNVFGLDEEKLEAEGYELQKKKVGVEFDEFPTARFGSKHKKSTPRWKKEETDLFYEYLKMCGTDFSMISKFFPNRTRKMIVNKFHCEERKGKKEFLDALNSPMSLDVSKFSRINGVDEQDLVDDFLKHKDRLLSGLPLNRTEPEHEDAISGEDDFVDVDSDNEQDNSKQVQPPQQPETNNVQNRDTQQQSQTESKQDDEIAGDDNFDSD